VEALAAARGLPLVVQWGTASGASVASRDAALAAARRATADYTLLAAPAGGGRYELRLWVPEALDTRLPASNWSGDLLAGVHGAADSLAASSIGLAVQPELETELGVAGVATLRDYVDVTRSLNAIAGVKALQLLEIGNGTAIYRLVIRGGDDTLQAALASDARFNAVARSGSRLNVAFRR
jgi:putative intracellular protease/amidase